jgi:hypothetical protein
VPQHTGWVFKYSNKYRNVGTFVLNRWSTVAFLNGKQLAQLAETGKAPVTFFRNKTVVCV